MSANRPARNQHLVPRYYLKGFSDPRFPEKIWVYRLSHQVEKPRRTFEPSLEQIGKVCLERDRFALITPSGRLDLDSVEQRLAQRESLANPLLAQLRERRLISRSSKRVLAAYMIKMHLRTRRSHGRRLEVARRAARDMNWDAIVRSAGYNGDFARALDVIDNRPKYEEEAARNVTAMGTLLSMEKAEDYLCAMRWQFLKTSTDQFFVTSDTPVVLGEGFGLEHSQAVVLFPISSHVTLWASWNGAQELAVAEATENEIYLVNSFMVRHAHAEVYARERADWISDHVQMQVDERKRMIQATG